MPDQKLIALYCDDEQRAWSIAEQFSGDETTTSVCATSDELHQLVTTTEVDAIVVDQQLPGFLTGLDILARLSRARGCPATVVLGDLNAQERSQAASLNSAVVPAVTSPEQIASAVHAAMQSGSGGGLSIPIAAQLLVKNATFIRPMPQLIVRIAGLIDDPDASLAGLAQELSTDARVTAELLKLVNSSAMGLSGKVQRIQDAVQLLGIKRTASLVLAAYLLGSELQTKSTLPTGVDHRLRLRRVLAAAAASTYATMTKQKSPDMAHVVALLQDLGILVLANELGKPYMQIFERCCNVSQLQLVSYEKDQLGFTHADVSAALLQLWDLPADIVRLVWEHHRPIESTDNASSETELLEAMQFGEALADLREQTSVGRTLWFQRLVAHWGRMDIATLRVCLMQSVRRAQELGQLFNAPAPSEAELRRLVDELVSHAEIDWPDEDHTPPAVGKTRLPAGASMRMVADKRA